MLPYHYSLDANINSENESGAAHSWKEFPSVLPSIFGKLIFATFCYEMLREMGPLKTKIMRRFGPGQAEKKVLSHAIYTREKLGFVLDIN